MSTARDVDRARVYAAEDTAFTGTLAGEPLPWHRLVALADLVRRALAGGPADPGTFTLQRARADAQHSSARVGPAGRVVRVAPGHEAPCTLTHELAHLVAGPAAGHGPDFRARHLAVVGVALGSRGAAVLAEAHHRHGLDGPHPDRLAPVARPGWGLLADLLHASALGTGRGPRVGSP